MNKWNKLYLLPVMLLSLLAWGCDSVTEGRLTGPSEPNDVLIEYFVNGVKVVEETDPTAGYVHGIFDQAGGELRIGKHRLVIPAGAVSGRTRFEMGKASSDLRFGLHATSVSSPIRNNVGAQGFSKPVYLQISYAGTGLSDASASALEVVWLKPLGGYEVQQKTVDGTNDLITGWLKHFSDYALAMP